MERDEERSRQRRRDAKQRRKEEAIGREKERKKKVMHRSSKEKESKERRKSQKVRRKRPRKQKESKDGEGSNTEQTQMRRDLSSTEWLPVRLLPLPLSLGRSEKRVDDQERQESDRKKATRNSEKEAKKDASLWQSKRGKTEAKASCC